jgi:hypothetical protein
MFFRDRKLTIFGGLEPVKPQIHECVKFGDRGSVKRCVTNMQKPGTSSWRWRELRKMADSGICRGPSSGVTREDMHEPSKKRKPIRESVEGLVRESHAKTFTNRRRSKVKVVVPKSPGFECELVADL